MVQIKDFFLEGTERRAALRLAVLGVIDKKYDDPQWTNTAKEIASLFEGKLLTPLNCDDKTLKRFALGIHTAQDSGLYALLAMYVIHQLERRPNLRDIRLPLKEALSTGSTLNRLQEFLQTGDHAILSPHTSGYDVGGLLSVVHGALGTGDQKTIRDHLFGGTRRGPISSYAMYRYSTGWEGIVKSFLTILSPEISGLPSYTFLHVYGGGSEADPSKRISRGTVLGFSSSICFLAGGGMIIDAETAQAPLNRGLKAFAVPHAAFDPDHRLLTGVMLSNSRQWYPIVGRLAMLHVGFSDKKGEITDKGVGINHFYKGDLASDIADLCEKFKLGKKAYQTRAINYILEKINNYPKVDIEARPDRTAHGLLRSITIEEGREPPD